MAGLQDVIQLPYRFFDYRDLEGLTMAVQRNFLEIERYLSLLQSYVKQATGGAVSNLPNTLSALSPDGTVSVGKLSDKLVGLTHALQLADQAVTDAKLAVAAVKSQHIDSYAVTADKIADGAVAPVKVLKWLAGNQGTSFPASPQDGELFYRTDEDKIYRYSASKASWVTVDSVASATQLAPGVVQSVNIANDAITDLKIAAGAVTAAKMNLQTHILY